MVLSHLLRIMKGALNHKKVENPYCTQYNVYWVHCTLLRSDQKVSNHFEYYGNQLCNCIIQGPLIHAWTFINLLDYSVSCETVLSKHVLSVTVVFIIFFYFGKTGLLFWGHSRKLMTRFQLWALWGSLGHCEQYQPNPLQLQHGISFIGQTVFPAVSYTHLDVYKRQLYLCLINLFSMGCHLQVEKLWRSA